MNTSKNYAGIPDQYAEASTAKITLIPVSFEEASVLEKGADSGPQAFLEASKNIELYDIETNSEVYKQGINLTDSITGNGSAEAMISAVHDICKSHIKRNKFVTVIGGNHAVSIGAIRAFNECFEDLTVLHIDAHTDLKKPANGTPYSQTSALYEANQSTNLVQVGIRSMDKSESTLIDKDNVFFAHEMINDELWMDKAVSNMTDDVYITFDLTAFDPSIVPSVSRPEPGGLLWYETLDFLNQVFDEKNVVGFDIVGLCPNPNDKSSDTIAAKLYYKMLSYKFENNR